MIFSFSLCYIHLYLYLYLYLYLLRYYLTFQDEKDIQNSSLVKASTQHILDLFQRYISSEGNDNDNSTDNEKDNNNTKNNKKKLWVTFLGQYTLFLMEMDYRDDLQSINRAFERLPGKRRELVWISGRELLKQEGDREREKEQYHRSKQQEQQQQTQESNDNSSGSIVGSTVPLYGRVGWCDNIWEIFKQITISTSGQ